MVSTLGTERKWKECQSPLSTLVEKYGSEVMNRQNVTNWVRLLTESRINIHHEKRSGRLSLIQSSII